MIFRQLFDESSCTYTYLIADSEGGKALVIDPVLDKMPLYQQLIQELGLTLVYAVDTHVHADHITALGSLRKLYNCETVHGDKSKAVGISLHVSDGDILFLDKLSLKAIYTPGHTDDSYCFYMQTEMGDYLFTGDTLLIRGTGRTDFQHGCSQHQYQSLFGKILLLGDDTLVYPGHDYKGMTVSTIGEEKRFNPRLQMSSVREYQELMNNLRLEKPVKMDVAVPANLNLGQF